MTDSRMAVGLDRLPWLADEPKPRTPEPRARARRRGGDLAGWAVAATLLVAGASYWLGTQAVRSDSTPAISENAVKPSATVRLPEPRPIAPPEEVRIAPTPEVRPTPAPPVVLSEPKVEKRAHKKPVLRSTRAKSSARAKPAKAASKAKPSRSRAARAAAARPKHLALWPAREPQGAYGRLVQIGAFGSRHQAKLGWRRMVRSYPAVGRLPAVVVERRNSRGRRFYRFQIGTSSQAHSEVLCQRMQSIDFSCAVVGLPWKPRGVER
jgi:SPOR domain